MQKTYLLSVFLEPTALPYCIFRGDRMVTSKKKGDVNDLHISFEVLRWWRSRHREILFYDFYRNPCLNVRMAFTCEMNGEDDVSPDAVAFHAENDFLTFLGIGKKSFESGDGLCMRHILIKVFFDIVKALGSDALDDIAGLEVAAKEAFFDDHRRVLLCSRF